jgi:hypothetical protein
MPTRSRRLVALALAFALALPTTGFAQEPAAAAPAGAAGSWVGWARLTNDWPGQVCRYDAGTEATPVRLELAPGTGSLQGSVAIDLPAEQGSGCPPLRKRFTIAEAAEGSGTLSFTDSAGNEWTLALRRGGTVLQGLLAWRQGGGAEQPLAEGFTRPDGLRPTTRLAGEVRLRRGGAGAVPEEPTAPEAGTTAAEVAPAAAPKPAGAGRHAGNFALILGANVVGLGLLYGANKLGSGGSATGVVTCSPRVCIVGATINDPCYCENNIVSGAPCGSTQSGAPQNSPCDGKAVPCQSGFSCNSGICQDRDGRCPY